MALARDELGSLLIAAAPYVVAAFALLLGTALFRRRVPPLDLRGKHVLITGGSSGIGLAMAAEALRRGAKVSLVARSLPKLRDAKTALEERARTERTKARAPSLGEPQVFIASADVTSMPEVDKAERAAVDAHGPVDVLVPVAGGAVPGYALDQDVSVFAQSMQLNYMGTVHAVKAVLPGMVARTGVDQRIIIVGSGASVIGFIGYASYCPAKFAVRGLADVLRNELCGSPVRVHVAYPPDTDTAGFAAESETKPRENKDMFPLDLYKPEDVAKRLMNAVCKADPPYHLPSPDPVQNFLVNTMAGCTPRWSVVGDALMAPLGVLIEGAVALWMDRVASRYGRRLASEGE